jgi:KipI family sensor histidine kinase inhibitor
VSGPAWSGPAWSGPAWSGPAWSGVRAAGDAALLVETPAPARLAAAVAAAGLAGVTDVLPGARTVLVVTEPGSQDLARLARLIIALPLPEARPTGSGLVEIPVVYDGPDLADAAALADLPVAAVISRHADAEYTVGWLGFAPGFGYLTGLDPRLSGVTRLATPRPAVPAGSVAIAGGLAAVYPARLPGGWRLLGRTAMNMWDPRREPPSLLAPGTRVRFRPVASPAPARDDEPPGGAYGPHSDARAVRQRAAGRAGDGPGRPAATSSEPYAGITATGAGPRRVEVLRPGPLATVQDLGRPGLASMGVPPSGAADPASLRLANQLAGNQPGAAGIELTLGRASFRCAGGARLAVTGAPARILLEAGSDGPADVAFGTAFDVPAGGVVAIGAPAAGLRTYLAVAGGIDVPAVLGSRSSDLHSGLGGGPLRPGAELPVGTAPARHAPPSAATPATRIPRAGEPARLRLVPGPRLDWFDAGALAILCGAPYLVTTASNRTGLRLDGQALPRAGSGELASEGMVTGALQVPHDGQPILLLADHPTVGGYPVIAVVTSADLGVAGQLRPGQQVKFTLAR